MIRMVLLASAVSFALAPQARAESDIKEGIGSSAAVVTPAPKKKKPAPQGKLKPQALTQPTAQEAPKDSPEAKPPADDSNRFGRSLKPTRKSLLKPVAPQAGE